MGDTCASRTDRPLAGTDLSVMNAATVYLKPNSITLASSELAPKMFGASSEPASVMEFGFYWRQGTVMRHFDDWYIGGLLRLVHGRRPWE